jgi:hypothetical protein
MSKISTAVFPGKSGTKYSFDVYSTDTNFKEADGIYVFSKREEKVDGTYSHTLLYIGETDHLGTRIADHENGIVSTARAAIAFAST